MTGRGEGTWKERDASGQRTAHVIQTWLAAVLRVHVLAAGVEKTRGASSFGRVVGCLGPRCARGTSRGADHTLVRRDCGGRRTRALGGTWKSKIRQHSHRLDGARLPFARARKRRPKGKNEVLEESDAGAGGGVRCIRAGRARVWTNLVKMSLVSAVRFEWAVSLAFVMPFF